MADEVGKGGAGEGKGVQVAGDWEMGWEAGREHQEAEGEEVQKVMVARVGLLGSVGETRGKTEKTKAVGVG